ncbi:ECF-type sigma factor [Qipengyuania gaetbuli]|uniref:ECF-type sigma factor n=1 Tax=Qipengyuania gaetbuli TaxID=266952 RepID=UPI001CD1FAE2|nr:ECF-type sigma factor [Qipengyuania gaetbuli]MCA0910596.1 sigma-70 family RNA polymerase sigma factor [Qipengyuania gaetbuli]
MDSHATRDGAGQRNPDYESELFAETYDTLRRIASRQLHRQASRPSLNTTLIVHEAWLKLSQSGTAEFTDHDHYLATAARAMRQILIDHARRKLAAKRGGGAVHLELDERREVIGILDARFVALDDALKALAATAPELEGVVECRFFAGLTVEETAAALGRSLRTVERQWARARAYLADELDS